METTSRIKLVSHGIHILCFETNYVPQPVDKDAKVTGTTISSSTVADAQDKIASALAADKGEFFNFPKDYRYAYSTFAEL